MPASVRRSSSESTRKQSVTERPAHRWWSRPGRPRRGHTHGTATLSPRISAVRRWHAAGSGPAGRRRRIDGPEPHAERPGPDRVRVEGPAVHPERGDAGRGLDELPSHDRERRVGRRATRTVSLSVRQPGSSARPSSSRSTTRVRRPAETCSRVGIDAGARRLTRTVSCVERLSGRGSRTVQPGRAPVRDPGGGVVTVRRRPSDPRRRRATRPRRRGRHPGRQQRASGGRCVRRKRGRAATAGTPRRTPG